MSLQPGIRLGVYSVSAKIGEGGMGEVYRARDTTLDRDVAIKVLPDAFASDPERLASLFKLLRPSRWRTQHFLSRACEPERHLPVGGKS